MRPKFYLGCFTTHILGKHYAHIFQAGREVLALSYGKDYTNVLLYLREVNRQGALI